MKTAVLNFTGTYRSQQFLPWMQEHSEEVLWLDFSALEGTHCYCDAQAQKAILESLPKELPKLRYLDSGDYHYLSCLLASREKEPFHLLLLDHHPDNQEAAFGREVLSCGSWGKALQEGNPFVRDILSIGPEGCPTDIPEGWLEQHKGERLYISLDKDILSKEEARTDWTQGTHTLVQIEAMLQRTFRSMEVVAVDICGELAPWQGATPEDEAINCKTNIELYTFIDNNLN